MQVVYRESNKGEVMTLPGAAVDRLFLPLLIHPLFVSWNNKKLKSDVVFDGWLYAFVWSIIIEYLLTQRSTSVSSYLSFGSILLRGHALLNSTAPESFTADCSTIVFSDFGQNIWSTSSQTYMPPKSRGLPKNSSMVHQFRSELYSVCIVVSYCGWLYLLFSVFFPDLLCSLYSDKTCLNLKIIIWWIQSVKLF